MEPEIETEEAAEEVVVPGAFEARQKRLDEIAGNSEAERVKGGEFEVEAEDEIVAEEAGGDEAPEEPVIEPAAKHKIKVNGVEKELTYEELLAKAQKVDNADQYLEKAKEAYKVVTERPPVEDVAKIDEAFREESRALARALQMGDEEEATKAVIQLRARPSLTQDVVQSTVDTRIALQKQLETVESQHRELLQHKTLGPIFRQRLTALGRENPTMSLNDGYNQVAESVNTDFGAMLKPATAKLERKAATPQVPAAGGRQKPPVDEDAEVPVSEQIRLMAKANHRSYQ
jgi:hypothetical protein